MPSHNEAPTREAIVAHCDAELAKQVRDAAMRDQRSISGWVRKELAKALRDEGGPLAGVHEPDDDRTAADRALTARRPAAQGG